MRMSKCQMGATRMDAAIRHVVVVGGGTAGWLTASLIAARCGAGAGAITVTLVESPEIPTVGVGEGTWPTMRKTLEQIGLDEADFLIACDASFKQGSRFDGWVTGAPGDSYLHPFAPPVAGSADDLLAAWRHVAGDRPFAHAVSAQAGVCALDLAPKQRSMSGYAGALNYGYHLDAVKLAALLARHATTVLGVRYIRDHVTGIDSSDAGDIASVRTRANGAVTGDLFIDCTGHASMLLGDHFGVPFLDRGDVLFNDRALAVQVPVAAPDSPIASQTISTAHEAGWIWDIGLPTRRGVGCVYSSRHASDEQAALTLEAHVRATSPHVDPKALAYRQLSFRSGHRARFWERNCLAIGLSAGFLEPLEASAIVLVEMSIEALLANFPANRGVMDIQARRFNALFAYRWQRIIDFLKLHYVLSHRQQPYWQDHRAPGSIPERLRDLLEVWRYQAPSQADLPAAEEVFPAASYQYILYGVGYGTSARRTMAPAGQSDVRKQIGLVEQRLRTLASGLPTNRALIEALKADRQALALMGKNG